MFSLLKHLEWVIAFTPGIFMKSNNKQGLKFFVFLKFHELKRISVENFISYAATLITPLKLLLFFPPPNPSCVYLGVECSFLWPQLRSSFLKFLIFFENVKHKQVSPGKIIGTN